MPEARSHARAAQLHQVLAQGLQGGQVEFGLAVQAARLLRRLGREHAVGAHHARRGIVRLVRAYPQVLAMGVEGVDVRAWR